MDMLNIFAIVLILGRRHSQENCHGIGGLSSRVLQTCEHCDRPSVSLDFMVPFPRLRPAWRLPDAILSMRVVLSEKSIGDIPWMARVTAQDQRDCLIDEKRLAVGVKWSVMRVFEWIATRNLVRVSRKQRARMKSMQREMCEARKSSRPQHVAHRIQRPRYEQTFHALQNLGTFLLRWSACEGWH